MKALLIHINIVCVFQKFAKFYNFGIKLHKRYLFEKMALKKDGNKSQYSRQKIFLSAPNFVKLLMHPHITQQRKGRESQIALKLVKNCYNCHSYLLYLQWLLTKCKFIRKPAQYANIRLHLWSLILLLTSFLKILVDF